MATTAPIENTRATSGWPVTSTTMRTSDASDDENAVHERAPIGGDRDEDVQRGDERDRADDRPGQVTAGVLRLFTGGRGGVEADVGEEQP